METRKLHHQLPNEGPLNRSSGTHNHSSYLRASVAGLHSTILMVIDGALSVRAKCLSCTTGHSPTSKTTPSCENTPSSAVAANWGNQMPQDWSFEILQIFYALFSHVWIPRIPAKRQGREKKHPKSHNHSLSCMCSCRLTARLVKWGMGLYLKGFKEASSSTPAPVLQLIVVSTQTHHGLAVYVQLLIQSLQEGWTCTLLATTTPATVSLSRYSHGNLKSKLVHHYKWRYMGDTDVRHQH